MASVVRVEVQSIGGCEGGTGAVREGRDAETALVLAVGTLL